MTYPPLPYQSPPTDWRDADHLRLVAIFHYIWGGFAALVSCMFIVYIVLGAVMISGGFATTGPGAPPPPPRWMGWMFVAIGSIGTLNLYSARSMQKRRRRTLSLIVAGINCLFMPLGTVLGVFTLIVLLRESVKRLYNLGSWGMGAETADGR